MIIQARFGSAQTGLGYQFYDSSGALLSARVTTGITSLPETGSYTANATVPGTATGVYWNSTVSGATATEDLREALAIIALPSAPSASVIASTTRTELATELARIDATVSSRNATTPPSAATVAAATRTELATELSRIDAAISTRNSTTPPSVGAIADAVWDEAMSGHTANGTAGSQLTAAGASGDPWASTVPGVYADGTAGAALGRLNNTPADAPVVIVPDPDADESLTVVYAYTESIANVRRAGVDIAFSLAATPAKSERLLETAAVTMTTDAEGFAQVSLQSGVRYRVESKELGISTFFTPTGETFDLSTLV